jgi:hypothetical protein
MFQIKVVEEIKKYFVFGNVLPKFVPFLKIMWKNIVERGRPQLAMWHMRIACCIPKATNTHSQYVILVAFPLQQLLPEHASMLRYTYIACLVKRKCRLIATARIVSQRTAYS